LPLAILFLPPAIFWILSLSRKALKFTRKCKRLGLTFGLASAPEILLEEIACASGNAAHETPQRHGEKEDRPIFQICFSLLR
jgi:hypothetical protein